jgi:hypothetical protein
LQKLSGELKNTPTDAPQVCSSVNPKVSREETQSAEDALKNTKLTGNNLEVDQSQHAERQESRLPVKVYVLNMRGKPLMPCSPRKASNLLKLGKAKVVKINPFTIQLTIATGETKQDITLGIDPGYKFVGFSAATEKQELISGTLELENGMKKRLDEKKTYRRNRRYRLWYRKPRFNNRANAREKDKLMLSVQRRLDTHINLVNRNMKLLPVTKVIVEVANFDIQKINNPEISEKEYQQGNLYNYNNLQSYVIAREYGKCQLCGKEYNGKWNLHHIIPRSNGGTDRPANIALLHEDCHKKLHKENLGKKLKKAKQFKAETFMSTIRWKLVNKLREIIPVETTFGYITNMKRNELELEKTHYNDAFVIAGSNSQEQSNPVIIVQKKRNNRCLQLNRKGFKPSIRRQRYLIQPKDIIWVNRKEYQSKGTFNYGRYVVYGDMKKKEWFKIQQIEKIFHTGGFVYRN